MNEIKEEMNINEEILHIYLWITKFNILKMSVFPKMIHRFNAIKVKIPANYLMNTDKMTLKFKWRGKRSRIANIILKKKKVGDNIEGEEQGWRLDTP